MKGLALALGLALGSGCASYTALSAEDRGVLERDLGRPEPAYLRLSYFVTPFFGDGSKKYLTALPPEEVRVLESPDGHVIPPGPVERVLPAGTRVHIQNIAFPTSYEVTTRIAFTPRTQTWVYLTLDGQSLDTQPYVLVLRSGSKTRAEFLAELDLELVREDPSVKFAQYPDAVREAIRTKRAMVDMPADALEPTWGYPEHKDISYLESSRREVWTYPGGKRKAWVTDGRVTKLEGAGA